MYLCNANTLNVRAIKGPLSQGLFYLAPIAAVFIKNWRSVLTEPLRKVYARTGCVRSGMWQAAFCLPSQITLR